MDFQSVCKEIQLNRSSLGIAAVIPMNQGIQNSFPQCINWIFCLIGAASCLRINNGTNLHVSFTESECFLHHLCDGSLNPFIVQETGGILLGCLSNLFARHHNGSDSKLRKISLRVDSKVEYCCQCGNSLSGDVQHFFLLCLVQASKSRPFHSPLQQVPLNSILIQCGKTGSLNGALIIVQVFAEGFIAV